MNYFVVVVVEQTRILEAGAKGMVLVILLYYRGLVSSSFSK